ncbi:TPA: hypothetical protein ACX6SR_000124 [Photobacterium damselae]
MKSKDLIKIFEAGSKILSYYSDKDIHYALNDILKMLEEKEAPNKRRTSSNTQVNNEFITYIDNLAINIEHIELDELQSILNNKDLFPNIQSLVYFSDKIGFSKQPRLSRENLIHTIIKYIDRSRIDKAINSRTDSL